jgi:hypothetical protein
VRKSLLVADRSAGRTRFSMLETIRQLAQVHVLLHRCANCFANRLDSRKDIELGNTREVSRARIAHGAH